MTKTVTFSLSEETIEYIRRIAEKEDRKYSTVVSRAVKAYAEQNLEDLDISEGVDR